MGWENSRETPEALRRNDGSPDNLDASSLGFLENKASPEIAEAEDQCPLSNWSIQMYS